MQGLIHDFLENKSEFLGIKTKNSLLLVLTLIILILNINYAIAIKANAPDKSERTFIYSNSIRREYSIYFSGAENINVSLSGELSRFMRLIDPNPNSGPRTVRMILDIPENVNLSPGWHEGYVVGKEISKQKGMVTGLAAIAISFRVLQLYPGVFITGRLSAPDTGINQTVFFQTQLTNWGTDNVSSVYALISIYSLNDSLLARVKTDAKPLPSKQSITLGAYFDTKGLKPGTYKVSSTAVYDHNSTLIDEKSFRIGVRNLKIINYTKTIIQGVINKFVVVVKNLWNQPANNVYAEITINNTKFKTPSEIIPAFGVTTLKGFIDASNINAGVQPLTIKVFLNSDEMSELKDTINVSMLKTEKQENNKNWLVIILLVLLFVLIINLVLYFVLKKHANQHEKQNKKKA